MSVSSSAVSSLCHIIRQFWWNSPTLCYRRSIRQCRLSLSCQLPQPLFLKPVGNLSCLCRIIISPSWNYLVLLELSRALGIISRSWNYLALFELSRAVRIISRSWKPQYFTQLEDELQRLQLLPLDLGVLPNKPRSSASLKTTTDWQLDEV